MGILYVWKNFEQIFKKYLFKLKEVLSMVQGEAILVLDLGNSSSKVTVMFGKDAKDSDKYRERTFELSNSFAPLPEGYEISNDYSEETSTVLRVDTTVMHGDVATPIKGLYCNGELQKREKPDTVIKPSAKTVKWELNSTALSLRLVFLRAMMKIMEMNRINDHTQVDITWKVVTLLPPGDFSRGKDKFAEIIKGITKVESVFPEMSFDVNVKSVNVFPEGFGAYVAVVFDKGNIIREGYGHFREETILVVDIGGGTTDTMVIQNNKMIQDSKYTIDLGGNNVLQLVRREILSKFGYELNEDDIKEGILKGYIKDGSKKVDIKNFINDAREEVSNKIVTSFNNYLDGTSIKIRSIGYVLFCGGGSMNSDASGTISLVDRVVANLQELAPNCQPIELPKVSRRITDEQGDSTIVEKPMETRMLNLIGASILAEVV